MPDLAIRRLELLQLCRDAGFFWGGDAGKELMSESFDSEPELAKLADLITARTLKKITEETALKFNPDAVFDRHRAGTFPSHAAAGREIFAIGFLAGQAQPKPDQSDMKDAQ
jgi:hypothetical protein